VGLTVLLQLAVTYVPFLNRALDTQPLSWRELAFCLVVSTAGFVAVELEKLVTRRGWLRRAPAVAP
jgi:Ca2+-transporting ATPase